MTLIWIGLLIIAFVVALLVIGRSGAPERDAEPLQRRPQVTAAVVGLVLGGLAAYPAALVIGFTPLSCRGRSEPYICTDAGREAALNVPLFGMLGFALLGLLGVAVAAWSGRRTSLGWLLTCLAGQALTLLGGIAYASTAP